MDAIKAGTLSIILKPGGGKLVQLRWSTKTPFNIGSRQLTNELAGFLEEAPDKFDGVEVEFELAGGQPHHIRLKAPKSSPSNRPPLPSTTSAPPRQVGIVEWCNHDGGGIHPMNGSARLLFNRSDSTPGIEPAVAVTYIEASVNGRRTAVQIALLRNCEDKNIISQCGTNPSHDYWKPIATKYIRIRPPNQHYKWLQQRKKFLAGMEPSFWQAVYDGVFEDAAMLAFVPKDALSHILGRSFRGLVAASSEDQRQWLLARRGYLQYLPDSVWQDLDAALCSDQEIGAYVPRDVRLSRLISCGSNTDELLPKLLESSQAEAIFNPTTWAYLRTHARILPKMRSDKLANSLVLAAAMSVYPEIAEHIPESVFNGNETVSQIAQLARAAIQPRPLLYGRTAFSTLTPEDVILGASYSDGAFDQQLAVLLLREQWQWSNVDMLLSKAGGSFSANFKVRALQPRIAELAFPKCHRIVRGEACGRPRDLNANALVGLPSWSVSAVKSLYRRRSEELAEDWEDNTTRYDVKSNLYFRSHHKSQDKSFGMRGFLVDVDAEIERNTTIQIPGIIFHDTSDSDASWTFIGQLEPTALPSKTSRKQRVSPFFFALPEQNYISLRQCFRNGADQIVKFISQVRRAATCEATPCNPIVPIICGDDWTPTSEVTEREAAILESFSLARAESTKWHNQAQPLSVVVWLGLTRLVFDLRSSGASKEFVAAVIKEADALCSSLWFPVPLARLGAETLLAKWIRAVLQPLNEFWSEIACPSCGLSGKNIVIKPTNLSDDGALTGSLSCECGSEYDAATLLTHCHRSTCGPFPLIIGKNNICRECRGLICTNAKNGFVCRACKRNCPCGR